MPTAMTFAAVLLGTALSDQEMSQQFEVEVQERLDLCEVAIGYHFEDRELLRCCLTHASAAKIRLDSNERLEFLGDSILGVIVCEELFRKFPDYPEGELTRIKSVLVSRATCARITDALGLEKLVIVGKGLAGAGIDNLPMSIRAAVFESIVAGVYLDGGLDKVRYLILKMMQEELELAGEPQNSKNYKSVLQQLSQKQFSDTPIYRLLDEKGPDNSKCFKVAAVIHSHVYAAAWGNSKKDAEQRAAQNALSEIQGKSVPHTVD